MNARLTTTNQTVLEIAACVHDKRHSDEANNDSAIMAIQDAFRCTRDKAAALLANARMAEQALEAILTNGG